MKRREPTLFGMGSVLWPSAEETADGFVSRARIVSLGGPNCIRFSLRTLGIRVRYNRAEAVLILSRGFFARRHRIAIFVCFATNTSLPLWFISWLQRNCTLSTT